MTLKRAALSLLLALAALDIRSFCQSTPTTLPPGIVAPAYQGFQIPRVEGTFRYAISASEIFTTGYYTGGGTDSATTISGDIAYLSQSKIRPFSAVYSGGYFASTSNQPSSVFQNLFLSQAFLGRAWDLFLSNNTSYLPQSPTTGLSGLAGVGDLGLSPVQVGTTPPQGVLTDYATRINNASSATVVRRITGNTSIHATGSLILQRFVGDSGPFGIDSTQETGSIGPSYRIDARNTIGADYTYSHYSFSGSSFSFISQGANIEYTHLFSRKLTMDVAAGPQITSSPSVGTGGATTNFAASVDLSYIGKDTTSIIGYSRGSNAGSGVVQGALTDNLRAGVSRRLGRQWTGSLSADYAHTASLPFLNVLPFTTQTFFGGVQASRELTRSLFAYASYTVQHQSVDDPAAIFNAFSGLSQVIGIGLTYSPASIHLGHR